MNILVAHICSPKSGWLVQLWSRMFCGAAYTPQSCLLVISCMLELLVLRILVSLSMTSLSDLDPLSFFYIFDFIRTPDRACNLKIGSHQSFMAKLRNVYLIIASMELALLTFSDMWVWNSVTVYISLGSILITMYHTNYLYCVDPLEIVLCQCP